MKRFVLLALFLAGCSRPEPEERYGFIALLGRDTISVERVTRQGNKLTSDEVDRFPRVRQRHTEITLGDSGTIRRLVMDVRTPSDSEKQRERHIVADVSKDTVELTKRDAKSSTTWKFATSGGVPTAHVDQMYSLYELRFQEARRRAAAQHRAAGDTVMQRQFYVDREFDRFPMNHGVIRLLAGNKAEIAHDWLAGTGVATFDSSGHMLTYSGARTTYLVEARRVSEVPDIQTLATQFAAAEAKNGVRSLSVRDTVRASIGAASFTVDYSRPLARGRTLLGGIIPYDNVWRTGANAATQFTTSKPITLAGLQLPAGGYTLWTVPRRNGVDLIVNKQTGQWGTSYDASRDLGRAPMTTETRTTPVEQFTISIAGADATHGTLAMEWGSFRWTAPIMVR
ncbi:MAG: DUF2911 domain-containing protein [Gemmatimonadaceae bacterium]